MSKYWQTCLANDNLDLEVYLWRDFEQIVRFRIWFWVSAKSSSISILGNSWINIGKQLITVKDGKSVSAQFQINTYTSLWPSAVPTRMLIGDMISVITILLQLLIERSFTACSIITYCNTYKWFHIHCGSMYLELMADRIRVASIHTQCICM